MANNRNHVSLSRPLNLKKGDTLRIKLKAKQYIPDFIRPYWNNQEQ